MLGYDESMVKKYLYQLDCIQNTTRWVKKELTTKFPDCEIIEINNINIVFSSQEQTINNFRILQSPLRIRFQKKTINLFRRQWQTKHSPSGINPSLAFILCQIANLDSNDILYDPFCGSSTIPITAMLHFPVKKIFASDLNGKSIDNSQTNLQAANINPEKFIIFRSNISMVKLPKNSITRIITNLPFGIRSGSHQQNIKTYQILSRKITSLLKSTGSAIILTQEKKLFIDIFTEKFLIKKITTIEQGGLNPTIFKLTKKI